MVVNRKEIARRAAHIGNYDIGGTEELTKIIEDVIVNALANGESVKFGKVCKWEIEEVPKKKAYDGLNKKYFTRPAKRIPKYKPLKRITDIELPVQKKEE
ncbi:DNA binding protein [Bacillus phage Bcp1]|uniref:Putative DNA-binding protein n=1 Tax=Bacillus phage Bcp1 TaxID=584892 RepID=X2JUL2_9CAUD|nr:DNA binding protein [Bacillus phage Bcp1]AHN66606.1 putative DNA-binding protein [Bacillus phage Bcp1]AXQ67797.1 DNA binding protein [Bacillus phage Kioshi]